MGTKRCPVCPGDPAAAGDALDLGRKTVAMARVMMSSPSVVLLDEPTANLAPIPSAQLLEQDAPGLAAAGVVVVLVAGERCRGVRGPGCARPGVRPRHRGRPGGHSTLTPVMAGRPRA
ncbi:MAG TPA: hypothetical protein VMV92_44880, partial [Streptosporangiaceae bacterium]|nr:hypothetical protein [Streptosporangiaceae bacterium]